MSQFQITVRLDELLLTCHSPCMIFEGMWLGKKTTYICKDLIGENVITVCILVTWDMQREIAAKIASPHCVNRPVLSQAYVSFGS